MGRAKTPALVRVKDAVLDLPDDEQDALAEWLEMFIEVRDQERARRERRTVNVILPAGQQIKAEGV